MKSIYFKIIYLLLAVGFTNCSKTSFQIKETYTENKINPIGIESENPKLSWQIASNTNGFRQSAYQIIVSDNPQLLNEKKAKIWNSGRIESDQSIFIPFDGERLISGKKYYWKVKVWDSENNESNWSETATWQMGLLTEKDWDNAKWIGYEEMPEEMRIVPGVHGSGGKLGEKGKHRVVVPLFRKDFTLKKNVKNATLFISGLGHYEASINGSELENLFLTPGWTHYDKTVFYNSYDITEKVKRGENTIGVIVGPGFYNINRERYRKMIISYGYPKMICKILLTYNDDTQDVIVSNEEWKTTQSPILYSSIYGGEFYDANYEQTGWNKPKFDDSNWKNVLTPQPPTGKLTAEYDYPVKIMESFEPTKSYVLEDGTTTYDFGQNASGIIEISVTGQKGDTIEIWPSELIFENKIPNQRATGRPHYYSYILKGEGKETWKPKFTYYGLRYAQVKILSGNNSNTKINKITFHHTRNSSPQNGSFSNSNELFNKTSTLINWGIKSNFQSVMTDCPHREKLGWMEQTYLMGEGIHYNFDIYQLYKKLIDGMIDGQTEDGLVPTITPEYPLFEGDFMQIFRDSPEWGSSAVILPYLLYKWYGDTQTIDKAWDMMERYVNYLKVKSENHIVLHGLSDWYDLGPERPGFSQLTTQGLTATAIYYYDIKILAEMARATKKWDKIDYFEKWADEIKDAFNNKFFDKENITYATGSQTSLAMPYVIGLVEDEYKDELYKNFIDSIIENDKRLTAGDVGFHYVVSALRMGGDSQLLFEMNNRDDVPGYGYQLKKGATALTESWMALESVSNNHLMLGHIMEWFYNGLAGIMQADNSTAYKNLMLKPQIVDGITSAKASFNTPYGEVISDWKIENSKFIYNVTIPANSFADLFLPFSEDVEKVTVNNQKITDSTENIEYKGTQNERRIFQLLSGNYTFEIDLK